MHHSVVYGSPSDESDNTLTMNAGDTFTVNCKIFALMVGGGEGGTLGNHPFFTPLNPIDSFFNSQITLITPLYRENLVVSIMFSS